MKNYRLLLVLLCLGFLSLSCEPLETVRVVQVIDGDTIVLENGERVRYIGIDAPELRPQAAPFAVEAWQANRELVEGMEVILERDVTDRDEFGRLLRYVYVGDLFVNAELVRRGMAVSKEYPPDITFQSYLNEMEYAAQGIGRGLWAK